MDNSNMSFETIMDNIEDDCKTKKMRESILLLKRKMCKTHDLINQYSENTKEIAYLKSNLEFSKKEAKHTISNYKSAMDKIRELELKIVEDKQKNEKLRNKIDEYETNVSADKQNIQQLKCKIKDMENENSAKIMEYELEKSVFKGKIKDLEHKLKKSKVISKVKETKISSTNFDMAKPSISTKSSSDIGINVSLCDLSTKCEVQDKNIMTDEFYNVKDDPYPLFCAKCEAHLPPNLTPEKICKVMSAYPKLIERDLSPPPKKIYSPSSSLFSTYLDSTNRNEDALSRISMSHLSPYSPCSDSIIDNPKSQSGRSSTMQISENVELRNMDSLRIPVAVNLSNNLNSIPTTFTLSQNRNYTRENFCSDDLLAKHSSSIKEIESKIRSLESKMKKFRRLKEKVDNNFCRSINCNDILLNSNLISIMCKSVAEYYDQKACSKNNRDIGSEKCICNTKKAKLKRRHQLDKSSTSKNTFSACKIENLDEKYQLRNMFCKRVENTKAIDTLQCEHMLSAHKNNLFSDINTSSMSLDDSDQSDKKEFVLHKKNMLQKNSAEVISIEDSLTSRLSADEIYASDNLLDENDVETIDVDNKTEIGTICLSNNENSTDYNSKIIDINTEKNEIKSKEQNIHAEVGEINASDKQLLNKDNLETMDNQIETETVFLYDEDLDSTGHTDGKIINITNNAEKNVMKNKTQNIHKDMNDETFTSENLLNKDVKDIDVDNLLNKDIKDIDVNNQIVTTFLSDNVNSVDHDGKIDINAEENIIKNKTQNIHKDMIDETFTSKNLLNKDGKDIDIDNLLNKDIKDIDVNNQIITTFLSDNVNSIDHDGKIDINAEENIIKNEAQNIHKDKIGEICNNVSDNFLNKDTDVIDMDNQTKIERTSLSKENSTDHTDKKIIYVNAEKSKIKRKGQNISKNKVGDRILKKIRTLKRKTRANSGKNKQENVELFSCSDYSSEHNELAKKSQFKNEEESGDCSIKNIMSLKRKLDTQAESINKQDNKICSDDYEPTKKRIAHIPKTSVQLSINENFTHSTVRNIATLVVRKNNSSIKSKNSQKCDEKNVTSMEINSIDRRPTNEKDLDLTSAEDCLQNNIVQSAKNINCVSEFKKCNNVLIKDKINRSISMNTVIGEMSNNSDEPNVLHNDINDTKNNSKLDEPISTTCIVIHSKSNLLCKDSKYDRLIEEVETIETRKEITSTTELNKSDDDHERSKDAISNSELLVLHDRPNVLKATRNKSTNDNNKNNDNIFDETIESPRSPSPGDSDWTIFENYTNDSTKESLDEIKNTVKGEETYINNETIVVQAIQTRKKNVCANQHDKETKFIDVSHEETFQTPMSQLLKYISQSHTKKYKLAHKQKNFICNITDKFVKKQLRKLINSAWEKTIHDDIIEKLRNTCGPRIIAKCIVEFLLEEVDHSEALDKSFTPPAPLMTKFEQKIVTLLIDLEVLKPTVIYFVQAAIEYNLFKINSDVKTQHVDSLTRIYVILSRIRKDREKVRMMCCNALYSMGLKSISVLYTTLIHCWPEIFPNANINKEILPKCIAFLINSHQIENAKIPELKQSEVKLKTLKNHILRYYQYPSQTRFFEELMTTFKAERINGLGTAIILIAKKEGPSWTYENIIQSVLLPMIIKNEQPCIYSAFSLLGRLLRAFPSQDNAVKNISEQLCDLIKSGQGSQDQQEGIISALLSLSRHQFKDVAPCVIKWTPSKSLRPIVNTQLQAFINLRNSRFWKSYLESLQIKY